MAKTQKKFYAVAKGLKPGIYQTWFGADGAEAQVKGIQGARFKGFPTRKEAEEWIASPETQASRPKPEKIKPVPVSNRPEADIVIYTDGSALNNPGPGGYGVVIQYQGKMIQELSEGFQRTTNNRMELLACIMGLRYFQEKKAITLYSDSKYVVDGITKKWAQGWRKRGWKKSNGENALNPDLWEQLLSLTEYHQVDFRWVKGHAGNPGNERCDVLANTEAAKSGQPIDKGYQKIGS
ncbi:MAG: ribonuclease HI [Pseudomonadota bacterium]